MNFFPNQTASPPRAIEEMTMSTTATITSDMDTRAALKQFLNCYWLRPENAFWMVLRSQVLSRFQLAAPCVDVSCGDGIFNFLHAGGQLDPAFDVFTSVANLDNVADTHADIFDHVDHRYRPIVTKRADYTIDTGTDWKQNLLDKANHLKLYDNLIPHDNNRPLPFDDEAFETVYCNAIYWVDSIETFLAELHRVCRTGGRAILEVKLDSIKRYTMEPFADQLGPRWLDIIGRGRFDTWLSLTDQSTWEKRFAAAGFDIEHAVPFITRTHAQIWDVGLRPIAPMLIKMANAIDPDSRQKIKAEWVDLFLDLLDPITRPDFNLFPHPDDPGELLFVLKPR
jgi:SAM-dependent methyltransferase